jgi:hypothetical protein
MPTSPITAPNSAADDQPPVLDHVGQRHQQQEAGAVAELRQRHDQAGQARVELQRVGDRADQRLGVVDVGHAQAASCGEWRR